MTAPANNDAALVREARELADHWRRSNWTREAVLPKHLIALDDALAATAERAEEEEVAKVNAWERRDELEAALLAAEQERDEALLIEAKKARAYWGDSRDRWRKRAREAEATNTRLREAVTRLLDGDKYHGHNDPEDEEFARAALAQDAEQTAAPVVASDPEADAASGASDEGNQSGTGAAELRAALQRLTAVDPEMSLRRALAVIERQEEDDLLAQDAEQEKPYVKPADDPHTLVADALMRKPSDAEQESA